MKKNKTIVCIIIFIACIVTAVCIYLIAGKRRESKRNIVNISEAESFAPSIAEASSVKENADSGEKSSKDRKDLTLTKDTYGEFYYAILQNAGFTRNDAKTKSLVKAISDALKEKNISTDKIKNVQIYADENLSFVFDYESKKYTAVLANDSTAGTYHVYILDGDQNEASPESLVENTMNTVKIKDLPSDALAPFHMDETQFVQKLAAEAKSYGLQYQTLTWGSMESDTDTEYSVLIWMNDNQSQNVTVSLNKSTNGITYVFG